MNVESKKSLKQANELIDNYMSQTNQEVLADIIDELDHVVITGAFNEASNSFSSVIIRVQEPGESVFILLKGDIPMEPPPRGYKRLIIAVLTNIAPPKKARRPVSLF